MFLCEFDARLANTVVCQYRSVANGSTAAKKKKKHLPKKQFFRRLQYKKMPLKIADRTTVT